MTVLDAIAAQPRGARFYRADLHIHSHGGSHDVKDATMTPAAIVGTAIAEGLGVAAITDHNEIRNVAPAVAAATGKDLFVVPGVGLSTPDGHLLCYLPTVDELAKFHGRLSLADRDTPTSRCQTALLECLRLLEELGGFGVLAHVDGDGGFEQVVTGYSLTRRTCSVMLRC